MPSELSRDDVVRVAALASLELDPSEIELFARQLGEILAYAQAVQKVDTTGVPPTAAVAPAGGADRADEVQPCLSIEAALANAPDADRTRLEGGFFRVPRVIG